MYNPVDSDAAPEQVAEVELSSSVDAKKTQPDDAYAAVATRDEDPDIVGQSQPMSKVPLEFSEEETKKYTYYVTKKMADHPVGLCFCTFGFILLIVIVVVVSGMGTITEGSNYDWLIASSTEVENIDALEDAIDQVDPIGAVQGIRTEEFGDSMFFIYESKDGQDLYSAANLQSMCEVESALVLDEKFVDFCQLRDGECILPGSSLVMHFYEFDNLSMWNCSLLDAATINSKSQEMYSVMDTPQGQQDYGIWLDTGAVGRGYSVQAESVWTFGAPLAGYNSPKDREDEQEEEYQEYLAALAGKVGGVEETLFDMFGIDTNEDNFLAYYPSPYMATATRDNVGVQWFSGPHASNETVRLINSDLFFAIFSILFVWFWLRVHTQSCFIASMGMYMIFCSLPFSIFIYRGIFQIPFFTELHILITFVILGIGADDVFVLVDSWRMTPQMIDGLPASGVFPPHEKEKNALLLHRRLHLCYEHTMATVFNTSFTTGCAFLATALSPLMPIATFGVYAATCVVVNYIFVITMMPPALLVGEIYVNRMFGCCGGTSSNVSDSGDGDVSASDNNGVVISVNEQSAVGTGEAVEEAAAEKKADDEINPDCSDMAAVVTGAGNGTKGETVFADSAEIPPPNTDSQLDSFFVRAYIQFMETGITLSNNENPSKAPLGIRKIPLVALIIAIGLGAFGIFGTISGTALETPTEQEEWFPPSHMFTQVARTLTDGFLGFDDSSYEEVTYTMGISGIDRSGYDYYRPGSNRGKAKFNDDFELAAPACQRAMVKMCEAIPTHPCTSSACAPTYLLARANTTECFITQFRAWNEELYADDTYTLTSTEFYSRLDQFRENATQVHSDGETYKDLIGFIDNDLKFASVYFLSTMESESTLEEKSDVRDSVNALMNEVSKYEECTTDVSDGGCDCSSLMYTSSGAFAWMISEQGLIDGFYQGMMIAFPVAFCVLMFATGNIIISVYAIISVFFISFGVLGFANYALGWSLGVAESIAGIIIIGFSVDYTVHLGHMYTHAEVEAKLTDRKSKFEYTSRKIVGTIVGGAITTLGSGAFLFATQLTFFTKMAALICSTIILSYVYSLGFFMSVLYLIGPEGNQGNLRYYWSLLTGQLSGAPTTTVEEEKKKEEQKDSHGGDTGDDGEAPPKEEKQQGQIQQVDLDPAEAEL